MFNFEIAKYLLICGLYYSADMKLERKKLCVLKQKFFGCIFKGLGKLTFLELDYIILCLLEKCNSC